MKIDWRHWFKEKPHHGYERHPTKLGKIWHFLAHDESWLSFIVDAILVVVIGKFVLLPVLGIFLGTSYPLVAVVSDSMEHRGSFDKWWLQQESWYAEHNISRERFLAFPHKNGFNKGDAFVVRGISAADLRVGDVVVYKIPQKNDPIIHRIVSLENGAVVTKGDGNLGQLSFEYAVQPTQIQGKAAIKLPLLGWVKTAFVDLVNAIRFK